MRTPDRRLSALALVGLVFFTTLTGGFTVAALFDVETAEVSLTVAGNAGPPAQDSGGQGAGVAVATPTPEPTTTAAPEPTTATPTPEAATETLTSEPTAETPTPESTTTAAPAPTAQTDT